MTTLSFLRHVTLRADMLDQWTNCYMVLSTLPLKLLSTSNGAAEHYLSTGVCQMLYQLIISHYFLRFWTTSKVTTIELQLRQHAVEYSVDRLAVKSLLAVWTGVLTRSGPGLSAIKTENLLAFFAFLGVVHSVEADLAYELVMLAFCTHKVFSYS